MDIAGAVEKDIRVRQVYCELFDLLRLAHIEGAGYFWGFSAESDLSAASLMSVAHTLAPS